MLSGVYPCWIQPKPRQILVLHISLLPPASTRSCLKHSTWCRGLGCLLHGCLLHRCCHGGWCRHGGRCRHGWHYCGSWHLMYHGLPLLKLDRNRFSVKLETSPIRMISWQTMMDPIIICIYVAVLRWFHMAVWFLFKVFVPKNMSLKGQQIWDHEAYFQIPQTLFRKKHDMRLHLI